MSTYYVRQSGNDTNGGTSPASAWRTIGHAIASVARSSGGDTIYVGAGTYREVNGAIVPAASGTGVLTVQADVDGSHTGDAGEVIWTGYTAGDTSAPSTTNPLLKLDNAQYLTIQGFVCIGSGYSGGNTGCCFDTATANCCNAVTVKQCTLITGRQGSPLVVFWPLRDAVTSCTVDSCGLMGATNGTYGLVHVYATPSAGATDYDTGFRMTNCLSIANGNTIHVMFQTAGSGSTGKPGGGIIRNCTLIGGVYGVEVNSTGWSAATPAAVYNSAIWTEAGMDLRASTSGILIENYNLLMGQNARSDVVAGANSKAGYGSAAFMLQLLQETWQGKAPRPMFSPMAGSPLLGFGNDAGAPATDFFGAARPSGGGSLANAVGFAERRNTATRDAATYHTAAPSAQLLGPASQDVDLVVGGASTTVSVWCRYNAAADYTTLPQVQLLANAEIGVAAQTVTAVAGQDGVWQQLTLAAFTPTLPSGVTSSKVTLRLTNGVPSSVAAQANYDDISVA